MGISLASICKDPSVAPPRGVIYGPHGIGKTTFGAGAPSPILMPLEEGWGTLATPRFPLLTTYAEVCEAIGALYQDAHEYATVIVDSLDWLEPLIWAETCARHDKPDIEAWGYGKGYLYACDVWREFLAGMSALREEKGMCILLLAHAQVRSFNDPTNEPYDRYELKLQPRAAALIEEWADIVGFANWRTYTTSTEVKKGVNKDKVTRGIGTGERLLHVEERPGWRAKNRYSLPPEIPLSWQAFASALTPAAPAA